MYFRFIIAMLRYLVQGLILTNFDFQLDMHYHKRLLKNKKIHWSMLEENSMKMNLSNWSKLLAI